MENGLEISLLSTQYECSSEIQAEKGVCFLRSITAINFLINELWLSSWNSHIFSNMFLNESRFSFEVLSNLVMYGVRNDSLCDTDAS